MAISPFTIWAARASLHAVGFRVGVRRQRLELAAEFDDIAVAILPVVEEGEILFDVVDVRHRATLQEVWRRVNAPGRRLTDAGRQLPRAGAGAVLRSLRGARPSGARAGMAAARAIARHRAGFWAQ